MGRNAWGEAVTSQHAAGTLLNTFTTAKSVINAQAQSPLSPAFWYPGKMMKIEVAGAISNIVTTPGTITLQVMLGTIAAPIVAFTTGAIQLNATAHTTLPFWLDIMLRCDTEGSGTAAKLMGQTRATGVMFTKTAGQTDGANTDTSIMAPATNPAVGTGFDSTIVNTLDFWAGFSISNAGNGVRIDQFLPIAWDIP
jgi:hypothetical protein